MAPLQLFLSLFPIGILVVLSTKILHMLFTSNEAGTSQAFPEFEHLATAMSVRLAPGRGYVVTRIPTVARTNPMRRQITLDRKVFFALAPEERLALVAHELAHLRRHHSVYAVLIASGGSVVALLLLPSPWPVLSVPAWVIGISGMLIFRRLSEYQADLLAAKFVDPQRLASALMKLSKERRSRVANLTHPSPSQRVAKLTRGTR